MRVLIPQIVSRETVIHAQLAMLIDAKISVRIVSEKPPSAKNRVARQTMDIANSGNLVYARNRRRGRVVEGAPLLRE